MMQKLLGGEIKSFEHILAAVIRSFEDIKKMDSANDSISDPIMKSLMTLADTRIIIDGVDTSIRNQEKLHTKTWLNTHGKSISNYIGEALRKKRKNKQSPNNDGFSTRIQEIIKSLQAAIPQAVRNFNTGISDFTLKILEVIMCLIDSKNLKCLNPDDINNSLKKLVSARGDDVGMFFKKDVPEMSTY